MVEALVAAVAAEVVRAANLIALAAISHLSILGTHGVHALLAFVGGNGLVPLTERLAGSQRHNGNGVDDFYAIPDDDMPRLTERHNGRPSPLSAPRAVGHV